MAPVDRLELLDAAVTAECPVLLLVALVCVRHSMPEKPERQTHAVLSVLAVPPFSQAFVLHVVPFQGTEHWHVEPDGVPPCKH